VVIGAVEPDVATALAAVATPVVTVLVHRPATVSESGRGPVSFDK
jgi:hypothetical protein